MASTQSNRDGTTIYNALELNNGIRLAQLQPSVNFSDPIRCELVNTTIDDAPKYEALSYAWGDASQKVQIHLQGLPFQVTTSLESALRHLRLESEPRLLWADAICIDQANLEERNQQVQLMKEIYSNCTADLAWIGEATADMERGINLMKQLDQDPNFTGIPAAKDENSSSVAYQNRHCLQTIFRWPKLWTRVWIMQEISYAPRVLIIAGTCSMSWDILTKFLENKGYPDAFHGPYPHSSHNSWYKTTFAHPQIVEHQRGILSEANFGQESYLLDVLSRFRKLLASDPRDKIYALLGLAKNTLGIKPDYGKSVSEVYTDFSRSYINHSRNLDLLTQCQWRIGLQEGRFNDLPSWVPDFYNVSSYNPKVLFAQRGIFSAGEEHCKIRHEVSNSKTLTLEGIYLGRVSNIKILEQWHERFKFHPTAAAAQWLPDYLRPNDGRDEKAITTEPAKLGQELTYFTSEDRFHSYWRTLMTDCTRPYIKRLGPSDISELEPQWNKWLYNHDTYISDIGDIFNIFQDWQFVTSDQDYYCMVPREGSMEGDHIVILDGSKVPMLLRPIEGQSRSYSFVGGAYVHGFMDGEAREWVQQGKLKREKFILV